MFSELFLSLLKQESWENTWRFIDDFNVKG